VAANNRKFQEFMDRFAADTVSTKVRSLMWECWVAATEVAEADEPTHNSDYTAAIRVIKEYCQSRPDSTMLGVFRVWCEDRLNPARRDFV
jgi:hypothetical protein